MSIELATKKNSKTGERTARTKHTNIKKNKKTRKIQLIQQGLNQTITVTQWLKRFCEAEGAPDEAGLEQTPYPFQPH